MSEIQPLRGLLTIVCLLSGAGWAQLTYKTTSDTSFSGNPNGLAVDDINRDGLPDVAVIADLTISVMFNHGSGVFGPPHNTALTTGSTSMQMLAADRKSTRLNSSHVSESRMPSSA